MSDNFVRGSKFQQRKQQGSVDEEFDSSDHFLATHSSSSKLSKNSYVMDGTKQEQHVLIETKHIFRRLEIVGRKQSKGNSRSSNLTPSSLIFSGEYAGDATDSSSGGDSSYSTSSLKKIIRSSTTNGLLGERRNMSLKVLSEGTKLMKSMMFPTVMTKIIDTNLEHSMVYYVTLESQYNGFVERIPALMFSSYCCSDKRTDVAELLPFCVSRPKHGNKLLSLKPMLRSSRYRRIFREGCSFKIRALSRGRVVDRSVEYPWNLYNLCIKKMQQVVTEIIDKDIREFPQTMLRGLKPLKRKKTITKRRSWLDKIVRLSQSSSNESARLSEGSRGSKLSNYCSDLEFTGLTTRGGSSFAEWFKTIPPNVRVDQNFKCSRGTILRKDTFSDKKMFEKYLCISETV